MIFTRPGRDSLNAVSIQWWEVLAAQLRQANFYENNWQSMNSLENARAAGLDTVLTLQKVAIDLQRKLAIDRRWDPDCTEWKKWESYVVQCDYYRFIDVLEGLVVARLFELTKMNQSETGQYFKIPLA
jgi:hypothetical protein